ncbi:MAG TPA: hypothetical protein VGV61_17805 [Thermoanaerobaculia bacterium]|nr:hypothetical protein [Thermoanaerobaculia bacterium]
MARNYSLSERDIREIVERIEEHEQEIHDAWDSHFGS